MNLTVTQNVTEFNLTVTHEEVSVTIQPTIAAFVNQAVLDNKVDKSQVLTPVPSGALFTDTQLSQVEVGGFAAAEGFIKTATALTTTVDATLFDGNLAPTDTDLQKVAQKVDDLVIGGGGILNYMTDFYVDNPNIANWVGVGSPGIVPTEWYVNTTILKENSPLLISNTHTRSAQTMLLASENQIIDKVTIKVNYQNTPAEKIAICSVSQGPTSNIRKSFKLLGEFSLNYLTLEEESYLNLTTVDFIDPQILKNEIIVLFFASTVDIRGSISITTIPN